MNIPMTGRWRAGVMFTVVSLVLVGCGAQRQHEQAFRANAPSDLEAGGRRERDLKWMLDQKHLHEGMFRTGVGRQTRE